LVKGKKKGLKKSSKPKQIKELLKHTIFHPAT